MRNFVKNIKMKTIKNENIQDDIILYSKQFDNKEKLIGKTIKGIIFYLDDTDIEFSEQENIYGKSLLNGIDIITEQETFSIGNRYTDIHYGLSIDIGKTDKIESVEDKKPVSYTTSLNGHIITKINIYWMTLPIVNTKGYYPQEIEIYTENNFLLFSSIEINNGEVNTEFTNELLIIDNKEMAKQLKIGQFGIADNERYLFENLEDITKSHF